jgi:hypothetical protein
MGEARTPQATVGGVRFLPSEAKVLPLDDAQRSLDPTERCLDPAEKLEELVEIACRTGGTEPTLVLHVTGDDRP